MSPRRARSFRASSPARNPSISVSWRWRSSERAFWRCCPTPISTEATSMEVILLQKVANLGNIGERVKVRSGYGRNFLLPQGKATLATPENIARFEARRAELERLAREQLVSAEERAAAIRDFKLVIHAKAGTEGKLFGSIGTSDVAEACTRDGFNIERSEVRLPTGPLGMLGEHLINLHLHAAIDTLAGEGKPCDVGTVSQQLERTG